MAQHNDEQNGNVGPEADPGVVFEDDVAADDDGHTHARTQTENEVKIELPKQVTRLVMLKNMPKHLMISAAATQKATMSYIHEQLGQGVHMPSYTHATPHINQEGVLSGLTVVQGDDPIGTAEATILQGLRVFQTEAGADMPFEAIFSLDKPVVRILHEMSLYAPDVDVYVDIDARRFDPAGKTLDNKGVLKTNADAHTLKQKYLEYVRTPEGKAAQLRSVQIVTATGSDALTDGKLFFLQEPNGKKLDRIPYERGTIMGRIPFFMSGIDESYLTTPTDDGAMALTKLLGAHRIDKPRARAMPGASSRHTVGRGTAGRGGGPVGAARCRRRRTCSGAW